MANIENTETKNVTKQTKPKQTKVDKEKEELERKLKEQEKQMKDLQEKLDLLLKGSLVVNQPEKKSRKNIKFVNMTSGGFTIRGNRLYHLDKQFDSLSVAENEAKTIVSNMPQSISNGLLYIADADFVEECELDGIYEKLIDEATLKNLLKYSANDVCEIYRNASDEQKKIIIDMIVDKKINNIPVDANILVELGNLCGKKLIDIEPLDEE